MSQWQPGQYDPRQHQQRLVPPTQGQPQYEQPVSSSGYREPMIVHPHAQQHVAPPFPQPQYQPPWQPPRRKSWARRHKFLTSLGALAAAIIVIVIAAAASSSGGKPDTAALAACTSHRAISSRQWLQVVKDPGAAKGECLTVYGEVSQFDSVTGDSVFRAQAGGVKATPSFGFVNYPTNALFDGDAKMLGVLVENDLFTAQVTVAGSQSYDTTLGGQTTVPVFRVDSVTRTGHLGS